MSPFFSERQREQELAQREADGLDLWTTAFSDTARNRLVYAWRDAINTDAANHRCQAFSDRPHVWEVADHVNTIVLKDLGWMSFKRALSGDAHNRLEAAFQQEDDGVVPSLVEGVGSLFKAADDAGLASGLAKKWEKQVNAVLRRERVGYELVEGDVVEIESQELHDKVVAPVLRLLAGRDGWDAVEAAYQDALDEDDPADAILDVSTALQEALRVRGFAGEQIGPQIKSALNSGILAPYDTRLGDAIATIMKWVGAERGQRGGTHRDGSVATHEDAWLVIHIVGAIILRFAAGDDRGATA